MVIKFVFSLGFCATKVWGPFHHTTFINFSFFMVAHGCSLCFLNCWFGTGLNRGLDLRAVGPLVFSEFAVKPGKI